MSSEFYVVSLSINELIVFEGIRWEQVVNLNILLYERVGLRYYCRLDSRDAIRLPPTGGHLPYLMHVCIPAVGS